jgi:hypothetical protein
LQVHSRVLPRSQALAGSPRVTKQFRPAFSGRSLSGPALEPRGLRARSAAGCTARVRAIAGIKALDGEES